MNYVAVLLIGLVGFLFGRSDAVLCNGTCTSHSPLGKVTCDKAFKSTKWFNHEFECSGVACEWMKIPTRYCGMKTNYIILLCNAFNLCTLYAFISSNNREF